MATALKLPDLRDIECATEIVPPRWIDDDGIIALHRRYPLFTFERFTDGTLLVTPPPGWPSGTAEAELLYQVKSWARLRAGAVHDKV